MTDPSSEVVRYKAGFDEGYLQGQWQAFNRILDVINTLEFKLVDKADIYHKVFEMRPINRSKETHVG